MREENGKARFSTRDKVPLQKAPSTGSFITSTRIRRTLPAASETMKLERETQEKMRKLAELRSNIAVERQVREELRKEVSTKGWWNLSPMPSGHDKASKPTRDPIKSLLQQPPPSNFKIKRSSTFKSSPDAHLKENKGAKYDPSTGHAQTFKSGSATPYFDEEEVHCKSAGEALKEWHNTGRITPSDMQQTRANPQQQFQAQHVPSPYWDEGTGRPVNVDVDMDVDMDTPPVEVQPNRTRCTMDTQTERPRQAEIELDQPTTLQGTYFQHLCSQGRKVQA